MVTPLNTLARRLPWPPSAIRLPPTMYMVVQATSGKEAAPSRKGKRSQTSLILVCCLEKTVSDLGIGKIVRRTQLPVRLIQPRNRNRLHNLHGQITLVTLRPYLRILHQGVLILPSIPLQSRKKQGVKRHF
ncbi:hypothetical protein JMJ35_006338 [Cladonia borealis]|uniref:Uncharacterized protein n=1 Tax=Cladonia borealis TaxID=184061 RepID=A0AA39QZ01_9LECA|nr:hypothetical protein JMJ35_006338 [Cladonia borealis]